MSECEGLQCFFFLSTAARCSNVCRRRQGSCDPGGGPVSAPAGTGPALRPGRSRSGQLVTNASPLLQHRRPHTHIFWRLHPVCSFSRVVELCRMQTHTHKKSSSLSAWVTWRHRLPNVASSIEFAICQDFVFSFLCFFILPNSPEMDNWNVFSRSV